MGRCVLILLLACGCGRLGFSESPNGGCALDAAIDASPFEAIPLARWRLNETASGQPSTSLIDDTADPVHMGLLGEDGVAVRIEEMNVLKAAPSHFSLNGEVTTSADAAELGAQKIASRPSSSSGSLHACEHSTNRTD